MDEIMNQLRADAVGDLLSNKKKKLEELQVNEKEAMVAAALGFPQDAITEEEIEAGVVSNLGGVEQAHYLVVRNHILVRWRNDVNGWVEESSVKEKIQAKHHSIVKNAYNYLSTYGYINFGVSPAVKRRISMDLPTDNTPTVIVIGAGLAGLAAARQLLSFQCRVLIVEARERPGGRVYTKHIQDKDRSVSARADLGGSVLTGIHGNPLGVLARQLGLPLHHIREECPLYQVDGQPVPKDVDDHIYRLFNDMLERTTKWRGDMDAVSDKISLGTTLDNFYAEVQGRMSAVERQLVDWHLANLEYANAALMRDLSLAYWDQDDPYELEGDHCFLSGGNIQLVDALAENMPIHYNCNVQTVRYGDKGVEVVVHKKVKDSAQTVVQTFEGDMVLCTLPLGVLKRGRVEFQPELPQRKRDAIARMGFGLLNKVALLFSHAFWGQDLDTFGRLASEPKDRGEFFLFYSYTSVSGGPLLMALMAGEAALDVEETKPEQVVEKVMRVLRGIYDPKGIRVPAPLSTVCTRWGIDPFVHGSYSYVAVGSSGEDYDALAEPVGNGRLFFAGEATIRRYPATMHGAFLSGMREAGNIRTAIAQRADAATRDARALVPTSLPAYASAIASIFQQPDVEFGIFEAVFDPRSNSGIAPALLRLKFQPHRMRDSPGMVAPLKAQDLCLYCVVTRAHVMALREVKGDQRRLNFLEELGVKLVGRRGFGAQGDQLVAAIRVAHTARKSGLSKSEGKLPRLPGGAMA